MIYQTCQRLVKPRSVLYAFILSLFSSNHTRMIWPDDLSPAWGGMFSPDRNQKHIIKDRNTAGSRSSPLPVLQVDRRCADENTSDGPQEETRPERSKKFSFFFFCLSAHPSFSLSFCLKVSPSVTRTLLSLIFLVNVQVLLCFQWLFKLDSADYLNLDLAFYFTICLACFASQFINCSFTHSFFILSASPQSANDCLLSLIQFLIKILLCWSCREIQAQQSPQERCAGTCSAYQSICIILLIIIGSSKQNAK